MSNHCQAHEYTLAALPCPVLFYPAEPTAGNGADLGRYSFTQTLSEVSIQVPVPKGIKARDMAIAIKRTHLTVGLKGKEPILQVKRGQGQRNREGGGPREGGRWVCGKRQEQRSCRERERGGGCGDERVRER